MNKYLKWGLICLIVFFNVLLIFLLSVKANGLDEFNKTFSPPDPLTSYHYKDNSNWTTWNKIWFGSAISLYGVGDVATSVRADNMGCIEANPALNDHPSAWLMALIKLGIFGASWYVTEHVLDGSKHQQNYRNWHYGTLALFGGAVTYHNYNLNCN